MPDHDPLHPEGRCTCTGEGKCEYCQRMEPARVEEELRERVTEVLGRVRLDNRIKAYPGTPGASLLESDLTFELILSALVNMEERITDMGRELEDLRHEILG